jgi:hypothetical protein
MTTPPIRAGDGPGPRPPAPFSQSPQAGRRRPLGAAVPMAALGLLLLLVLTACSGGAAPSGVASLVDPSASPDGSPAPSIDPEDAMEAFTDCMKEHGVDVQTGFVSSEDGGSGGGPVTNSNNGDDPPTKGKPIDKDKLAAADKACKSLLPQGGMNAPGGEIDPEFQDKMLEFAKCMREHGVDMPDPQFGSGGNSVTIGGPDDGDGPKIDPESRTFKDAEAACGSLLPGKLGPGTGSVEVQK